MQRNIFPTNYKITLEPDLNRFIFKGTELITLKINGPTSTLKLDAVNIRVSNCFLLDGGSRTPLSHEILKDKLQLSSNKFIDGENVIEIEFEGELNDKLAGFYRSQYEEGGKQKFLATTQFEAADARQAFPCFDEPAYKATFDITLIVDEKYTAISNMPVSVEKKLETGKKSITFDTTPIMSTYLLYFGVGEFEIKEDNYKNVLLRGITTKGKSSFTDFSVDVAKKSLEYFEEYFKISYPLPKLDLIAIPDFASGAMENWGAITFRENAILYYPGKSSLSTKQRIAEVVAHELAHQWFGNLVTMKWWDDLWLNESFATFMAYKVLNTYWPEWDIWTQYIMSTVFEGMALDSLKSSHAIKVEVTNVDEMNELFDEIAYDKGGSILRMVERFMGEDAFKAGLRDYMNKHQFNNTEARDLWKSLDAQSDERIESMVEKFITQVGFPYVTVDEDKISQERFLDEKNNDKSTWNIPLVIQFKDGTEKNMTMSEVTMPFTDSTQLQTINGDYGGFFISNYSQEIFPAITSSYAMLTSKEKIGFIHDFYYLARFGKQPFSIFMKFINTITKDETESVVLFYLVEVLEHIYSMKETVEIKNVLLHYAKRGLDKVGMEPNNNDSTNDIFLRTASLSALSQLDDEEVNTYLNSKFQNYLKDAVTLHPDLKMVTYSSAMWNRAENYEVIKKLYLETAVQEEKVKLLFALANSKDSFKVKETLDFCLTKDVRFANAFVSMNSASKNPYGKEVVLDWMIENWSEFGKRVGGHGGTLLRRFVKIVIPTCGIGHGKKVEEFIAKNRVSGLEKTFEQVEEELEINANFVNSI